MKKEAFANFTLNYLPTLSMLIFIAVFITACYFILRKSSKEQFDEAAMIPLNDNEATGVSND